MRESVVETVVGACVLAVATGFVVLALGQTGTSGGASDGYSVEARFSAADGLAVGSDVRLAGVKVGTVSSMRLDQANPALSNARVQLALDAGVQVPTGTVAKIRSDGLLGSAYVGLEPACDAFAEDGGCPLLADGQEIEFTRGSVDLLTLFAQFAGGSGSSNSAGSSTQAEGAGASGTTDGPEPAAGGYPE